jgi:cytochrome c oxidase subunit 4
MDNSIEATAQTFRTHRPAVYWKTCGALMLLLAISWGVGYVDLGLFNLLIALAISIAKALLVALLFMHLKGSSAVVRLTATVGLIWLLIMLSLTLGDYFTRGWVPLNH